jgi:F1F0 ATPase subunit 2
MLNDLPSLDGALVLATYLASGLAAGIVYFRGLWWSARRFAGDGKVRTMVGLTIGRITLLCGALTLASLQGAMPLLTMALGVLIARWVVTRQVRTSPP